MSSLDLALSRVTIEDILNDAGIATNERQKIACPIHGGKKPNFDYKESVWICRSDCGKGGGLLDLIEALHSITRSEAVEFLHRLAGIPSDKAIGAHNVRGPMIRRKSVKRLGHGQAEKSWFEYQDERRIKLTREIQSLRHMVRSGKVSMVDFYTRTQVIECELEEIDAEVSYFKWASGNVDKARELDRAYANSAR